MVGSFYIIVLILASYKLQVIHKHNNMAARFAIDHDNRGEILRVEFQYILL